MIEKRWDLNRVTDRIQLRAIQLRRPLSCTMELTYRCNFHCRMCYIRMTDAQAAPCGRMRTAEEWDEGEIVATWNSKGFSFGVTNVVPQVTQVSMSGTHLNVNGGKAGANDQNLVFRHKK